MIFNFISHLCCMALGNNIQKTALNFAICRHYTDAVSLLLSQSNIDVNLITIFKYILLKFK